MLGTRQIGVSRSHTLMVCYFAGTDKISNKNSCAKQTNNWEEGISLEEKL